MSELENTPLESLVVMRAAAVARLERAEAEPESAARTAAIAKAQATLDKIDAEIASRD